MKPSPTPTIRLLGPIDAVVDGVAVSVGGARPRRLLAALALSGATAVSEDRLVDAVWDEGEALPANPRSTLQNYVYRLRAIIGAESIVTSDGGYQLARSVTTDVEHFEELFRLSAAYRGQAQLTAAQAELQKVEALWRGEPFGELGDLDWLRPEVTRLQELRLQVVEHRLQLQIELGEHDLAVPSAAELVVAHPLRERPVRLWMEALDRAGRRPEALRAYDDFRRRLATQTGLEPSDELRTFESTMLAPAGESSDVTTRIGSYDLTELIGQGAFGTIYRAQQASVAREVAVKVVRAEFANDPEFIRRFEVEAQLVARLEHPHIVPLYDFWREPGGAYLVMRFLRGGSAEERLVRDGPMALGDTAQLLEEIGGALMLAHRSGVVHRDVKPANILFDEDGHGYLTDFGISTLRSAESSLDLKSAGSPLYASPEQVRDGTASELSDVYSLGIVLYELLSGTPPFSDSSSVQHLLGRKLEEPLPAVSSIRADVPPAVDRVLAVATAVDPSRRFPSVADLMVAFRDATAQGAIEGNTTVPTQVDPPETTPRRALVRTLVTIETEGVNPYRGLAAFGEADTEDFHGRTGLASDLTEALTESRFVVVVGPSGSGKSSLVRAGVIPRLREDGAYVANMTPGGFPLDELETALHRVSTVPLEGLLDELEHDERALHRLVDRILPTGELVLFVDQFEELFTQSEAAGRDQFLRLVRFAATAERSRLRIIATLRADFYDRPLQHPEISELVRANTIAVTPLSATELEAAIVRPAARLGVEVEPSLSAELIAEVTANPSSLPLMQFVLTELYERREAGLMTLEGYRSIGGLSGALSARADALTEELGSEQVRLLFSRLVTSGEGAQDTRRRVGLRELDNVDGSVIEAFGDARLLTFDRDASSREPTVEVAHEAIIREWPVLRIWLDEDRDGLRLMRQITAGTQGWRASGEDGSELFRGARLEAAAAWSEAQPGQLTGEEQRYLRAGLAAENEQRARELRRTRRLRVLLGATAVIAAVALVAGAVAFQQRGRADSEAEAARVAQYEGETRRLASEAGFRVRADRQVGLLLAAEAFERDPGPESVGALQRALTNIGTYLGTHASGTTFTSVDWIDDERLLLTGVDGVTVVDTATGGTRSLSSVAVRSDLLDIGDAAFVTWAYTAVGGDGVAFVPSGRPTVVQLEPFDGGGGGRSFEHDLDVHGLALAPDGSSLATIDANDTLRLFDARSGEIRWEQVAHPERIFGDLDAPDGYEPVTAWLLGSFETFPTEKVRHRIIYSADGSELVTQEGILRRWSTESGEQLGEDLLLWRRRPEREATPVISHPAVTFLASLVDGRVAINDHGGITTFALEDGELLTTAEVEGGSDMAGLAKIDTVEWAGDRSARVLLSNGQLALVDTGTGAFLEEAIDTQMLGAADMAVSADGRVAAVAGASGVSLFGLDGSRAIARAVPRRGTHWGTITPHGDLITQDYADYISTFVSGQVLDASGNDVSAEVRPDVVLFHYTPLAPQMMMGMTREFLFQAWDLDTGSPLGPPLDMPGGWNGESATADNRLLAAGTGLGGLIVFDTASGDIVTRLRDLGDFVPSMSFNVDGTRLAAASIGGEAMVWDTSTWQPVAEALGEGPGSVMALRYSPDGNFLLTMDRDGNLALRDPVTHEVAKSLVGSAALDIADGVFYFSDDGRYLVTAADGAARLWDLTEGVEIGDPFPNDPDNRVGGADGLPRFVTAVGDYRLIWGLDVDSWAGLACDLAGRNLSPGEWTQFGPAGEPYRMTCAQWGTPVAPQGSAPAPTSVVPSDTAVAAGPGGRDPVVLGDAAAAEVLALLEAGDLTGAERACEEWEPQLVAASDTSAEVLGSEIGDDPRHRFWVIDIAVNLCAGQGFETAQVYLRAITDDPDAACVGYPSPCPEPRRWFDS